MRPIDADALDYRNDKLHDVSADFIKGIEYMHERITDAPTIDAVSVVRWIPCSERLPNIGEKVLVSTKKTCFVQVFKGIYSDPTRWHWEHNSIKKIDAWMPLPKPYGEREGE